MCKEIKISLPLYKIACALFFITILCLIRGVSVSYEVGIAIEPAIFQKPLLYGVMHPETFSEIRQFFVYLGAMAVTLAFWSVLANTISCIFRNLWFGMGGSLLLWILTTSAFAQRTFGPRNVFSYTYRNAEDAGDFRWLAGKGICIALCAAMLLLLPTLLKKRG